MNTSRSSFACLAVLLLLPTIAHAAVDTSVVIPLGWQPLLAVIGLAIFVVAMRIAFVRAHTEMQVVSACMAAAGAFVLCGFASATIGKRIVARNALSEVLQTEWRASVRGCDVTLIAPDTIKEHGMVFGQPYQVLDEPLHVFLDVSQAKRLEEQMELGGAAAKLTELRSVLVARR